MTRDAVPLQFPNPSRSYDPARRGIRFWGYDRTIEVAFFVEEGALAKVEPATATDEAGLLSTFDIHCERFRTVADAVYSQGTRARQAFSFTLRATDF